MFFITDELARAYFYFENWKYTIGGLFQILQYVLKQIIDISTFFDNSTIRKCEISLKASRYIGDSWIQPHTFLYAGYHIVQLGKVVPEKQKQNGVCKAKYKVVSYTYEYNRTLSPIKQITQE